MQIHLLLAASRVTLFVSALGVLSMAGCGDDDSAEDPHSSSGGVGGSGGVGAANGGGGGTSGMDHVPQAGMGGDVMCRPSDYEDDSCLKCLASNCCTELRFVGGVGQYEGEPFKTYLGYDRFFACVRSCFEDVDDAGGESPHDRLDACGRRCEPIYSVSFSQFLACASGGPQPRLIFDDAGVVTFLEGVPDEDAGIEEPNCRAECLPSW